MTNLLVFLAVFVGFSFTSTASGFFADPIAHFPISFTAVFLKPPTSPSSADFKAIGTASFRQETRGAPVVIRVNLTDLKPSAKVGFHVHALGNIFPACTAAGPHFNPFNRTHGGPGDENRHIGDLGNIQTDADGKSNSEITIHGSKFPLFGRNSVLGRTIVVHEDTDDLGKGNFPDSLTTGHAGARVACGVVGYA